MNAIKSFVLVNLLLLGYVIVLVVLSMFDVSIADLRIHFAVNFNYYYLIFIATPLLTLTLPAATIRSRLLVLGISVIGIFVLYTGHSTIVPW